MDRAKIDPDEVEQDTIDVEELTAEDMNQLIIPVDWYMYEHFSVTVSRKIMEGWVKQPSPSCAAASLAGVFNALNGYKRNDVYAYTCDEILEVYRHHFQEIQEKVRNSLESILGDTLNQLENMIDISLETQSLQYGGLPPNNISKQKLGEIVLNSIQICNLNDSLDDSQHEMMKIQDISIEEHEKPLHDDLVSKILAYFHRKDGLAKLMRDKKPSTALCGNQTIVQVAKYIHSTSIHPRNLTLNCLGIEYLMGKDSKSKIVLRSSDTFTEQSDAWQQLWNAFTHENTVLLFHLKNHYALIFGLREFYYKKKNNLKKKNWKRQILTAKRGQRPCIWMDWSDVYDLLLEWNGYKILLFKNY